MLVKCVWSEYESVYLWFNMSIYITCALQLHFYCNPDSEAACPVQNLGMLSLRTIAQVEACFATHDHHVFTMCRPIPCIATANNVTQCKMSDKADEVVNAEHAMKLLLVFSLGYLFSIYNFLQPSACHAFRYVWKNNWLLLPLQRVWRGPPVLN